MKYAIGSENYTFNYTYDNLGNITKVTDASGNTVAKYMYDDQNQLQLEEVYNGTESYTMLYDYDTFGNLLSAKKYSGTGFSYPSQTSYGTLLSTETYGYTDSSWKDLLTSYNGTSITYDAIGNPLSYYNGQSYTFTWENGRQLAKAVTGGKTVTFEYNADGIRTEKHLSGTHDVYYHLVGDRVVEMVSESARGTERLVFIYDDSGAPYGIRYYNGYADTEPSRYTFMLNLQGDVVRILGSENNIIANYTYDAWGNILAITDADGEEITDTSSIAHINPIRYRGYFYDTETGFYYCNSRYYDPAMRRFINADAYMSTGQGFGGFNMFAYCQNNPVMFVDPSGYSWYSDAGLTWPGEIHAAVQDYLIQTKMFDAPGYEFDFFSKEVYIESVGRIDLIDRGMGAYEIKPISYLNTTGLASAYFQLLAYVEASNGKYHLGTLEFSTNFIYKGYSVNVFSVGMGVILYSYTKIKQHQHENETVRQRNVVAVKNRTAAMKAFEAILINGAVGVPADIPADVVGAVGMGTVVFYGISSFLGGGDLLGGLNRQNMYVAVR